MDQFNFKSMILAYHAVYDEVLYESMEELGFFDEAFKSPDVNRIAAGMGRLEQRIPRNRPNNSPEEARYSRVNDVRRHFNRNPNTPFKRPTAFSPFEKMNALELVKRQLSGNPMTPRDFNLHWEPFSQRLPQSRPSSSGRASNSLPPSSSSNRSSPRATSSPTPSVSNAGFRSGPPQPGRGGSPNLGNRMRDYTGELSSRGSSSRRGGSGSVPNLGTASGSRNRSPVYNPGAMIDPRGYGIGYTRLAN